MTAQAAADIGHNSAAVGEILDERPEALFEDPSMLDALLASIEKEISAHKPDTTTEKGRKAIASLAYSIAKRKTPLDDAGKKLNESHRQAIEIVDKTRRRLRDELDGLRDKARDPLNQWEAAEEARKGVIDNARERIHEAENIPADATLEDVAMFRADIEQIDLDETVFGPMLETVQTELKDALAALDAAQARIEKAEADRAELERLRAEKAEQEREAEAKAAAEAAKKAEQDRIVAAKEAAANEERRKAEAAAAEERRKVEESAAEERRQAQAKIDAANREREAAERKLQEERDAKAQAEREAKAREADQTHRSNTMRAAKEAVMEHGEIDEAAAKKIVLAIAGGSIPNVAMRF